MRQQFDEKVKKLYIIQNFGKQNFCFRKIPLKKQIEPDFSKIEKRQLISIKRKKQHQSK